MTNRREFLQIGVGAAAWPLVAGAVQATGVDTGRHSTPLFAAIYDTRYAESVAFARRCEALGLHSRAIDGDMTRLWYDEIHPRWQRGPTAIAGLTAHGPLFCFAELARDVRMRIVFRAEHRTQPSGGTHAFTGPIQMVSDALRACRYQTTIGTSMADIVSQCPGGRVEIASASIEKADGVTTDGEDALFTWVIAPAVPA
jgi:hypothetical protein